MTLAFRFWCIFAAALVMVPELHADRTVTPSVNSMLRPPRELTIEEDDVVNRFRFSRVSERIVRRLHPTTPLCIRFYDPRATWNLNGPTRLRES